LVVMITVYMLVTTLCTCAVYTYPSYIYLPYNYIGPYKVLIFIRTTSCVKSITNCIRGGKLNDEVLFMKAFTFRNIVVCLSL
jgi:hypothetical protein